jgi:hypothetical protein
LISINLIAADGCAPENAADLPAPLTLTAILEAREAATAERASYNISYNMTRNTRAKHWK